MHKGVTFYYWRGNESPTHESLLLQDLAIAQWFPQKRQNLGEYEDPAARSERRLPAETVGQTRELIEGLCNTNACQSSYWLEQCQVAAWAIGNLEDEWFVHVMQNQKEETPLYYVIFNVQPDGIYMKGIWKSLLGTLTYAARGEQPPRNLAFTLLRWAYNQHMPFQIHVNFRLSFQRMLEKNNVAIQAIEKLPRHSGPQGRSIYGQFTLGRKEGLILMAKESENPGMGFVAVLDHLQSMPQQGWEGFLVLLASPPVARREEPEIDPKLLTRQFFRWMIDNPEKRAGRMKREYPLTYKQWSESDDAAMVAAYMDFDQSRKRIKSSD